MDEKTQENKHKGHLFETYVIKRFCNEKCTLLEWRSDKEIEGPIYPLSNTYPDTLFQISRNNIHLTFAIECKWRTRLKTYSKNITQVNKFQLSHYQAYGDTHNVPVLLALGVGGQPDSPESLYLIPVHAIEKDQTPLGFIERYKIGNTTPITDFFLNLLTQSN